MTHPVDQLFAIRAQIKALQELEAGLKADVSALCGDVDYALGDEYVATQSLTSRKGGIDEKALKAAGVDVEAFRKADVAVYTLKVTLNTAPVALAA